jgi:hypothetical protein
MFLSLGQALKNERTTVLDTVVLFGVVIRTKYHKGQQ